MHPRVLLRDAAAESGWSEETQISILCDFIAQANRVQPDFATYLQDRLDADYENSTDYEEVKGCKDVQPNDADAAFFLP